MSTESSLPARTEFILNAITRSYIDSGEPVGSGQISRIRRYNLSSASIRNIMAELMAEGFLEQPHTSAGRVPTAKAFQVFVQGFQGKRTQPSEVGRIRGELSEAASFEERVERSSHMLTEMTHSVGITAAIPTTRQILDQIELIRLSDDRVLMIVVTRDRMVRQKVVSLEQPISQDSLNSIRNYVNLHFGGCAISTVQEELRRRLEEASAACDEILTKLSLLYTKGLLATDPEPEVHLEGASNLVGVQFHLTRDRLRGMFRALEEKKRILQLLDRFLDAQPNGSIGVQIGLGEEDPNLNELSLIGIRISLPGGLSAKLAVLGPMRMNYERAVSAVLHVGKAFSSIPS